MHAQVQNSSQCTSIVALSFLIDQLTTKAFQTCPFSFFSKTMQQKYLQSNVQMGLLLTTTTQRPSKSSHWCHSLLAMKLTVPIQINEFVVSMENTFRA